MKSHCGDKTILRPSYLHNGISYTGKMSSLYWIGAQIPITSHRWPSYSEESSRSRLSRRLCTPYMYHSWMLWLRACLGRLSCCLRSQLAILDCTVTGAVYLNILMETLLQWARQTFAGNFRYQDYNTHVHRIRIASDIMEQGCISAASASTLTGLHPYEESMGRATACCRLPRCQTTKSAVIGSRLTRVTPCTTWSTVCRVVWRPSRVFMGGKLVINGLLTLFNKLKL